MSKNQVAEVGNALWKSYNGVLIAQKDQANIQQLSHYFKALSPSESTKIVKAFELNMFDMGVEYAWQRAIKILESRLEYFGLDFIAEMVNRESLSSLEQLAAVEKIELAFELGMINSTAKMSLIQASEIINHFLQRKVSSNGEEITQVKAFSIVNDITAYILGNEIETSSMEFKAFRDSLKDNLYKTEDEQIELLKNSPYFYIRTTLRTILSLIKTAHKEDNIAALAKLLNNANVFISALWDKTFIEDKKLIGSTYAQAISDGHKETVTTLSTILDSVHGYDYVPETTRSTAYKQIAREFATAHFGMNNFYNEPAYAKKLNSMGTVIPDFSLQECLRAVIVSMIGNQYGISNAAQPYNEKILGKVTTEQWKHFFSQLLVQDQVLLEKLTYGNSSMRGYWFNLVSNHANSDFNIKDSLASDIFEASKNRIDSKLQARAKKALEKIIGA